MKFDNGILRGNGMTFLVIVVIAIMPPIGTPIAGLLSILVGLINIVLGIIFSIRGKEMKARTALLIGGLLILIGCGLCSIFPLVVGR